MKYSIFTVGDKEYSMVLRARDLAGLENRMKRNPIGILFDIETKGEMPQLKETLTVFYYALQKEHGKEFNNFEKIYDLYDAFVENGGAYTDLISVVVDIFQKSGLIPDGTDEDEEPKNA